MWTKQPRAFLVTRSDRPSARHGTPDQPVHVLHVGLRQHVFAGRDRAHDVGHREDRLVVCGTVDRRREAVVAELGVFRLLAVIDEIVETAPVMRSATKTASTKPAKLSNGVSVNVPEFIQTGEKVRVNPNTGEYLDRAK